jgi:predicted secreted acid phosphatase
MNDDTKERILAMRDRPIKEIALETGLSYQSIYRFLHTSRKSRQAELFRQRVEYHNSDDAAAERQKIFHMCDSVLDKAKKGVVICDIDETAIDNYEHMVWLADNMLEHPAGWEQWCLDTKAPATGPIYCLHEKYHLKHNFAFVSSRHESLQECTKENMQREYGNVAVLCVGEKKGDLIRTMIRDKMGVVLYIDDQILPVNLFSASRVIYPNYVYGAHASYQDTEK